MEFSESKINQQIIDWIKILGIIKPECRFQLHSGSYQQRAVEAPTEKGGFVLSNHLTLLVA